MTTMDIGRAAIAVPERRSFGLLARVGQFLIRWEQRRSERATLYMLARMDGYLLRDIGIEPSDIYDALDGKQSSSLFDPARKA